MLLVCVLKSLKNLPSVLNSRWFSWERARFKSVTSSYACSVFLHCVICFRFFLSDWIPYFGLIIWIGTYRRDLPTCRVPVLSPHCLQYTSKKVKEIQKRKRRENSRDSRRYFWSKFEQDSAAFSVRPNSRIPPDLSLSVKPCGFDHLLSANSNLVSLAEAFATWIAQTLP